MSEEEKVELASLLPEDKAQEARGHIRSLISVFTTAASFVGRIGQPRSLTDANLEASLAKAQEVMSRH